MKTKKIQKCRRREVPLVELSIAEIRRTAKPHAGFQFIAPSLIDFYEANKERLQIVGVRSQDITNAIDNWTALRLAEVDAIQQLALVQSSRLYYASQAYTQLLELYARCKRLAKKAPDVRRAIAPFAKLMQRTGRRKAKKT